MSHYVHVTFLTCQVDSRRTAVHLMIHVPENPDNPDNSALLKPNSITQSGSNHLRTSSVTVIYGHITISMLCSNTAYIVSSCVVNTCCIVRINRISSLKKTSLISLSFNVSISDISQSFNCPTSWRENRWHRYGMKKERHWQ